jgi:hypothetical protein
MNERRGVSFIVIPAEAGIQGDSAALILDSCFRGNDGKKYRAR